MRAGQRQNWLRVRREGDGVWAALVLMLWIAALIDMHALMAARSATPVNTDFAFPVTGSVPGATESRADAAAQMEPGGPRPQRIAGRRERTAGTARRKLRAYTEDEIQELIRVYADAFGIDPAIPLAIARCESQFQWDAANRSSSARGVFQYVAGTWATTQEGRRGTSAFDADANIRMALTHMTTIGTSPWNASRACWHS